MVYWSSLVSWIGSPSNSQGTSERLCQLDTCDCKLQNNSRGSFVLLNNWCKTWLILVVCVLSLVIEFQLRFQSPLSGSWERGAKWKYVTDWIEPLLQTQNCQTQLTWDLLFQRFLVMLRCRHSCDSFNSSGLWHSLLQIWKANRWVASRSQWVGAYNFTIFLSQRFHRPIYF